MVNPFKEINWNPGPPERRKFALSLIIGLPCVALLLLGIHRFHAGAWNFAPPLWLAAVGVALGAILYALPGIAKPFYVAWYFIACCAGMVIANLVLTLLFYTAFTGIGLLLRIAGRVPFRKRADRSAPTYWTDAEKPVDVKRYYRQF